MTSIITEDKDDNVNKQNIKKDMRLGLGFGYIGPNQSNNDIVSTDTQLFNIDSVKDVINNNHHTNSYRFNNPKRLNFNKNKSKKNDYNNFIEKITYTNNDILTLSAKSEDSLISYQSNKAKTVLEKKLKQNIINNPYDSEIFERFEDCFVSDGVAQKTLLRKYSLINGHKYTFSLSLEYTTGDKKIDRENLKKINDFIIYKNALNEIRYRLEISNFYDYDFKACVLKSVFGRSVLEKIHNTKDYGIINFNVLYNQALGDPIISESNNLIGVEYEYTKSKNNRDDNSKKILPINKLMYYLNDDIPVSLGSQYFGLSEFESIIDASEGKKMILQTQSKEAIQTSYRGTGIFRTAEPLPDAKLTELAKKINEHRGNAFVMDSTLSGSFENTASNPEKMMIFLNEFNLEIIRGLNAMQALGGYENAQNFATLDKYSTIYLKSVIIPKQNEHKRFIKKSLLDEMFTISLLRQGYAILLDREDYTKKLYKVTLKQKEIIEYQDEEITRTRTITENEIKIKEQYQEILRIQNNELEQEESDLFIFLKTDIPTACIELNLEIPDFIEIQEYFKMLITMYDKDLATFKKVLESINMDDQIDEVGQLLEEKKAEDEKRFNMQFASNGNNNDKAIQQGRLNKLAKKENELLTKNIDNNKNQKRSS